MTFKQSQGHQTNNQNVAPLEGYNQAKFEKSCINGVQKKPMLKGFFFFKSGNVNYLPWTCEKIKNNDNLLDLIVQSLNLIR